MTRGRWCSASWPPTPSHRPQRTPSWGTCSPPSPNGQRRTTNRRIRRPMRGRSPNLSSHETEMQLHRPSHRCPIRPSARCPPPPAPGPGLLGPLPSLRAPVVSVRQCPRPPPPPPAPAAPNPHTHHPFIDPKSREIADFGSGKPFDSVFHKLHHQGVSARRRRLELSESARQQHAEKCRTLARPKISLSATAQRLVKNRGKAMLTAECPNYGALLYKESLRRGQERLTDLATMRDKEAAASAVLLKAAGTPPRGRGEKLQPSR
eukprot:TRINITY_DN3444_c0_g1_i1.p1 TRINITY_DN3444_c0_g1~~TRINITY_DN3444_c0_g1_i1.p1  ORF type:complete len:263 (+),score=22.93 TRINITY_DN3444_c0_g1_i1:126-914(+)